MRENRIIQAVGVIGVLFALSAYAWAGKPNIVNAKLEQKSAAQGLKAAVRVLAARNSPAWVTYAVPIIRGEHELCCGNFWSGGAERFCGECRLESGYGTNISRIVRNGDAEANLEPSGNLLVFLRVANRRVDRVRVFSEECRIDAGGRTVYWLNDVHPSESVTLLASLATGSAEELLNPADRKRISNEATLAVALHADPSAESALESFVEPSQPDTLREHTAFWLAVIRGHAGYEVLRRLARTDPDDSFRKKLTFDLYVSKDPGAVDTLIQAARNDSSPDVRGQALFWLAQKASQEAIPAISEAVERDPNTEVKKRAVFALSRLPKDQGIPLLVQIVRSSSNPVVRKAAMFWLGQSRDPRALAFFEQILTTK